MLCCLACLPPDVTVCLAHVPHDPIKTRLALTTSCNMPRASRGKIASVDRICGPKVSVVAGSVNPCHKVYILYCIAFCRQAHVVLAVQFDVYT